MTTPTFALRITQHRLRIAEVLDRTYKRDERGRFGSGGGGIRQSLQDAATTEAVAHVLKAEVSRILGRQVRVDFVGLDADVARVHAEGILRGAEAYPEARLRVVSTYGSESALGHTSGIEPTHYAVTLRGEDILFSTSYSHMDDLAGEMAHSDAGGHLAGVKGDLTRIATHEFGHVVDATTDSRMGKAALRIAKELAGPGVDRKAFTRVSVSRYAATNGGELAAEAFMDVVSRGPGASLLSQQIFSEARGLAGDLYDRLILAARTYKRDRDGKFSSGGSGGVRESLASAGTVQEVAAVLAREASTLAGREITADLTGSDLQVAREHSEAILQGLADYPHADFNRVETVGPASSNPSADYRPGAFAETRPGGAIKFNTEHCADGASYRADLSRMESEGYFTPGGGGTPFGIATHEFGHAVVYNTGGVKAMVSRLGASVYIHGDVVRREVSEYATTNVGEMAAEVFTQSRLRGSAASETSRSSMEELQKGYDSWVESGSPRASIRPTFLLRLAHARERAEIAARTYKRDKDGKFSSGSGDGTETGTVATEARVLTAAEANAWGAEHFTRGRDLAPDEREALTLYSGGAYANANKVLRGGVVGPANRGPTQALIDGVDKVMARERVPEDVVVSRACGLGIFGGDPAAMVGKVISDPAYFSTSVGAKVGGVRGRAGARPVRMRIEVPKGTHGYYMRDVTQFKAERELLLDRGLKIAIKSATQNRRTGQWTVTATILAP